MVREALDAFQDRFEGCGTLAYADLSTQLVLATNQSTNQSQDQLNELCAEAAVVLDGGHLGVVGTASGFRIFLRDAAEPTEGLICLCTLQADVAALLTAAQQCLTRISARGEGT